MRRRLLLSGWRDVAVVFVVACNLDLTYQLIVLRWFYLQTLIVAALLAIVPYVLLRGPAGRLASRRAARQHPLPRR